MADHYGGLEIPVPVPLDATAVAVVADPALVIVAEFCAAVLNAYAQAAWTAIASGLVVKTVQTHDPERLYFNSDQLPALYLDRVSGSAPYWLAEDYRNTHDSWRLQWVYPSSTQTTQRTRATFSHAAVRIIDHAVEAMRDPSYYIAGDTDEAAASVSARPTAIKTAIATSASAQSYAGAALNGSVGGGAFAPALLPSVTVTGAASSIADGSMVTFTGLGADGFERISTVTLTQAGSPGVFYGDWALRQTTSLDVDAQDGTAATLVFGLAAHVGAGSQFMTHAGLQQIDIESWSDKPLVIKTRDNAAPDIYDTLEVNFRVVERDMPDASLLEDSELAAQFAREDGTIQQEGLFT